MTDNLDKDGVAFDPAIHAVKGNGEPKKTPSGKWAVLPTGTVLVQEPQAIEPTIILPTASEIIGVKSSVGIKMAKELNANLIDYDGESVTLEKQGKLVSASLGDGYESAIRGFRQMGF